MRAVLLALIVVSAVFAHDKTNTPPPRVASESTTQYCGAGSGAVDATPNGVAFLGRPLRVAWDGNHNGGTVDLYLFSPPQANPSLATLQANVLETGVAYKDGSGNPSYNVDIPSTLAVGTYTLVWTWSGYWTCSEVYVVSPPPSGSVPSGYDPTIYELPNGAGNYYALYGNVTCNSGFHPNAQSNDCVSDASDATSFSLFAILLSQIAMYVTLF